MFDVRTGWVAVAVAAVALMVVGGSASAATDRVTRGEAEAVLQGYGTGGQVLRANGATVTGAPADVGETATIRPFESGRHYCAEDWHVVVVALIDGGDTSYTHEVATAFLGTVSLEFTLDGAPLSCHTDRGQALSGPGAGRPRGGVLDRRREWPCRWRISPSVTTSSSSSL